MMGIAHFYKQDYTSARRVFDYVSKEYTDSPIQYEGYLWLAKTHIETGRFEKAEAAINYLQSKKDQENFSRTVEEELPFVIADFYLAQENYDAAYAYLERGLEIGNDRDVITRVNFILGQINQMEGDLETATMYYNKVIKRNPEYRMAFEAKMNLAQCYDESSGDSKSINKVLEKMAKDYKNRDYLDQIYYAMADIALKDGKEDLAIEYLAKSVSSSTIDNFQRTESSLKLADIYFEKNKYQLAEAYYDTAVSFLPEEYPNYEAIKNKATVLTEMVQLSATISEQDSLLYLSNLDTIALYAIIDRIIREKQAEKEREELYGSDEGGIQFVDVGQKSRNPNLQSGKWYFYNTAAMSYGYSEFIKKWGPRKLEDNWRLSDRRLVMQDYGEVVTDDADPDMNDSIAATTVSDPENREYYLADIPFTDEQKQLANEQIVTSYKNLGFLYLEDLRDTINALETYLTLQERYPENLYRLESWYALYKIFDDKEDREKASFYKNLIMVNYPDSDYAKVISDPDYYIKLSEEKNKALDAYEKTYKAFTREQYFRVINYANSSIEEFPDDTALVPKFMYLRAVSLGKVDVPDTLYASLIELKEAYPNSSVTPMAQAILNMLSKEYGIGEPLASEKGATDSTAITIPTIYSFDKYAMHLAMIIVNSDNVEVDPLKIRLSDFKKKSFDLLNVRIKSLMLDSKRTIVSIGNFENKEEADRFYVALANDEYVFSGLNPDDYDLVTISIGNYPIFYKEKDVEGYLLYFNEYYLKDN
jgi:tetratricopeptide (TPR) repeat protein